MKNLKKVTGVFVVLAGLAGLVAHARSLSAKVDASADLGNYPSLVTDQATQIQNKGSNTPTTSGDLDAFGGLFPAQESTLLSQLIWTASEDSEFMGGCPAYMGNPTYGAPYTETSYRSHTTSTSVASEASGSSLHCIAARYSRYWEEQDPVEGELCMVQVAMPSNCW